QVGQADAVVAGVEMYYSDAIRPALEVIGAQEGRRHVSGIYMLVFPLQTLFLADCTVNIDPDAETLAEIASATAEFVGRLGIEPRVALLSFSNFGSVRHPAAEKVQQAVALLHGREPSLQVDGEMQADTAVTAPATQSAPAAQRRVPGGALEALGLAPQRDVHWNLAPAALYEHAARRGEGLIAEGGAFCAVTSPHTGRSPNDKFIVREAGSEGDVWWGRVNQPLAVEQFERLHADVLRHLNGQELFVRDVFAGADPNHRIGIRFVTPNAWRVLFVFNMLLRPEAPDLGAFAPAWQVLHAPEMLADPAAHGTKSPTFIVISFAKRTILIGGTRYAGELKKSVFAILNYLLPKRGVLSMHCSANLGEAGDVTLVFGLSGTGKTTLSADAERALIGDDEHGWSDHGVFNFDGGCYAKVIRLSR